MAVEVPQVLAPADTYGNVLSFTLNGEQVTIENPDPTTLLVDYLRSPEVGLTGTKLVCGEGGCGACTVLLTRVDPNTTQVVERAVNSCLHPLCSLDGAAVTTIEAIGSTRTGLDAVQQAMVKEAGTQCGFCTPGWVMNMEGLMRSGEPLTAQTIEDRFDGNLCRCTGMRPILNAMQTFANTTPPPPPIPPNPPTPQPLHFSGSGYDWYRPLTLEETCALLYVGEATYGSAKLVNGNTSVAIYKRDVENPTLLVDISAVPELTGISPDDVTVGAGLSLTELGEFLQNQIAQLPAWQTAGLQALYDHLLQIANVQVRSVGTIGGNLVMARQNAVTANPFPSDLFMVLATLGAYVGVLPSKPSASVTSVPVLSLPDFDSMPGGYVLVWLSLPLTRASEYVKTYKVARRTQNAHALVNAGFRVHFDAVTERRRCLDRPRGHRRNAARGRRLVADRPSMDLVDVAASGAGGHRRGQEEPRPDAGRGLRRVPPRPRRQPGAQVLRLARAAGEPEDRPAELGIRRRGLRAAGLVGKDVPHELSRRVAGRRGDAFAFVGYPDDG